MPQTKTSPWDEFQIAPENSAAAAEVDGGSAAPADFNQFSAAPASGQPMAATPNRAASPEAAAPEGVWKTKPHDGNGIPQELLLPVMENQSVAKLGPSGVLEAGVIGEPKPLSVKLNTNTGYYEVRDSDGKWINSFPTAQDTAEGLFIEKYAGPDGSPQMVATVNDPKFQESFKSYFGKYPFGGDGNGGPALYVDVGGQLGEPDPSRTYDDARAGAGGSADTFARSAANFFTAGLADDAEAALDTLTGSGTFKENIQRQHAINDSDWREHRIAYVGGAIMGALGLPSGISKSAAQAGVEAGSKVLRMGGSQEAAREAAKAAAYRAATVRGAGEGAAYGGVSGATSADNPTDAVTRAVGGATTGAIFGGGATAIGGKFVRPSLSAAERNAPNAVIAAADRLVPFNGDQPLDVLPADVGGPNIKRTTGVLAQSAIGGAQIINAGKRLTGQAGDALDNIAGRVGSPTNLEDAGTQAASSASNWISKSGSRIGRIYDTANDIASDAQLELPSAKSMVDAQIARLSAVPGANDAATSAGKSLVEAQTLRRSLDGKFGVQGIRDMRTEMFVAPDFRGTPAEGRMKSVVQAAADDIEAGLRAKGLGKAADAFKTADTQWKQRIDTIERVIEPIVGTAKAPKSGEQVVKNILTAAQGDQKKLARFLDTLDPETRNMTTATVINRLGQKAADNTEEGAFSFATFLTNWDRLGPRAKREMFGPETKSALDDLVTVARGSKEAQKYANHSNTGGVDMLNLTSGSLGASVAALFSGNPVLAAVAASPAVIQAIGGKLLASPRFARWLARAPKDPSKVAAWIGVQLPKIARAEPRIANDIFSLSKRLTDAFSGDVPLRAAAQQDQGNSSVPDWDSPQYESDNYGAAPAAANDTAPYSAPAGDPNGDPSMGTPYADDGTDGNYADWTGQ